MYIVVAPYLLFCFLQFHYLQSVVVQNVKWKISEINHRFQITSHSECPDAVSRCPAQDVNHPFVRCLHAANEPCPVVT